MNTKNRIPYFHITMILLTFVIVGGAIYAMVMNISFTIDNSLSQFGDFIAGVGGTIAILWLVYTAHLQRKQLNTQSDELRHQVEEMKSQREEFESMVHFQQIEQLRHIFDSNKEALSYDHYAKSNPFQALSEQLTAWTDNESPLSPRLRDVEQTIQTLRTSLSSTVSALNQVIATYNIGKKNKIKPLSECMTAYKYCLANEPSNYNAFGESIGTSFLELSNIPGAPLEISSLYNLVCEKCFCLIQQLRNISVDQMQISRMDIRNGVEINRTLSSIVGDILLSHPLLNSVYDEITEDMI